MFVKGIWMKMMFVGVMLTLALMCSCSSGLGSEFADDTQQVNASREVDKNKGDVDLPGCPEGLKERVTIKLVTSGMKYIRLLPDWEYPLRIEQLIERGIMAVIPYNPTTGEGEMQFTKEWYPGGCYYYDDGGKYVFIRHLVECDAGYDNELYLSGQSTEGPGKLGILDGRSVIVETPSEFVTTGELRAKAKYDGVSDEEFWMRNLSRQVGAIVQTYSKHYPDTLASLDEYLEWIGSRNEKAFTNPYTGMPMVSLPPAVVKVPDQSLLENRFPAQDPNPEKYAGNYSEFQDVNEEGVKTITFFFYYIDSEGELTAYGVMGYPRKLHRQGIMKGFGMEYYGD